MSRFILSLFFSFIFFPSLPFPFLPFPSFPFFLFFSFLFLPSFLFCMWLSNYSSIVSWRDYLCPFILPLCLCQRSVDYICVSLFQGSLFCSIDLFVYSSTYTKLSYFSFIVSLDWHFRPFTCKVIIILGLKCAILFFVLGLFSLFLLVCVFHCFPVGYLNIFNNSIVMYYGVFVHISFYSFLVVILGITLYI